MFSMLKMYGLVWIMLISTIIMTSCERNDQFIEVYSPDKSMYVRIDTGPDTPLIVEIYDTKNSLLYHENIGASKFHSYDVKWINNKNIIIDSADIGSTGLIMEDDGKWHKYNPLAAISPNRRLAAIVSWHRYSTKCLSISIVKVDGDVKHRISTLVSIDTDIVASNLINIVRWEGDNRVVIKADDGTHKWLLQNDNTLIKVEESNGTE